MAEVGKHLAYVASSFGKNKPEYTYGITPTAYVTEDSKVIGTHDQVLWMAYSPKDGSLWYVAKDKKSLCVFKNGKAVGTPFDALVMTPRFLDNGALELGSVKGQKVAVMSFKAH